MVSPTNGKPKLPGGNGRVDLVSMLVVMAVERFRIDVDRKIKKISVEC